MKSTQRLHSSRLVAGAVALVLVSTISPARAQTDLNSTILNNKLTQLEIERIGLLQLYRPDDDKIRNIDAQIAGVRKLLSPSVNGQLLAQAPGVFNGANQTLGTVGNTANNTLGTVGNSATGVVGGLNSTLQPVGQGVGNALNNLTQPDTIASLLEFLAGVIPNHIEAHVNLDSLRVDKLTVDVRGVDLRNLRVDLLVANSRNAGQVRSALPAAGTTTTGTGLGGRSITGASNSGARNMAPATNSTTPPQQ